MRSEAGPSLARSASTDKLVRTLHPAADVITDAKERLRRYVPEPALRMRRKVLSLQRQIPLLRLKYVPRANTTLEERKALVQQVRAADSAIVCAHTTAEIEALVAAILDIPGSLDGCIVEAGCFKGGSTAKLSLAAKLAKRQMYVFDSFAGLPQNAEEHDRTIFGDRIDFHAGRYKGRLEEVKANVGRYGALDVCHFVPGWFEDTMPGFHERIAVAFVDVDLASSTATCLRYLYPLLVPGGSIFSHDGHLPLCMDVIRDDRFWNDVVGAPRPPIPGLGRRKLLRITKPSAPALTGGR